MREVADALRGAEFLVAICKDRRSGPFLPNQIYKAAKPGFHFNTRIDLVF